MLTSDLDGEEERGKICLENLISAILSLLKLNSPDLEVICARNSQREVQLVVMRLLSKFSHSWGVQLTLHFFWTLLVKHSFSRLGVLMSRTKSSSKSGNASFVSQTTANMLLQSGIIDYCLVLLQELIPYWKKLVFIYGIINTIILFYFKCQQTYYFE